MPTATVNPAARRTFVLDSFRVQGAKTPHGNPQTAKELIPYCEEMVCEGLYTEVMEAVARHDPALALIAGVSDEYLLWAIDMTMYYFVISSLKARGIVNNLDATGYFTFQYPKPDKWVLAEQAAATSTAAFGQWIAQRETQGSRLAPLPGASPKERDLKEVSTPDFTDNADAVTDEDDMVDIAEKIAPNSRGDMDELVDFMNHVVL